MTPDQRRHLRKTVANAIEDLPDGAWSIAELAEVTSDCAIEYLKALWDVDALRNRVDEVEGINSKVAERWESVWAMTANESEGRRVEITVLQRQNERLAAELEAAEAGAQLLELDVWCLQREVARLKGSQGELDA